MDDMNILIKNIEIVASLPNSDQKQKLRLEQSPQQRKQHLQTLHPNKKQSVRSDMANIHGGVAATDEDNKKSRPPGESLIPVQEPNQ